MPMPSAPLIALFLSVACLQSANGLFVVLLGLRMVDSDFPTTVTGLIMSAYFLGLMIGSLICRNIIQTCLLYTSPSPRDLSTSRMPSSA